MSFSLHSFPDDGLLRQVVAIDGIETSAVRTSERRWIVGLRTQNGDISKHTVSSQYLWAVGMGSLWTGRTQLGLRNLPIEHLVSLHDLTPRFIWRTDNIDGMPYFCEKQVAGEDSSSKFPAYQLVDGFGEKGLLTLCISSFEIIRFFIGRSPSLSRHFFDFTENLSNSHLYRYEGASFRDGTPKRIEIIDRNLGIAGRKLLVSILSDPIGKDQILAASRAARAAVSRSRENKGKFKGVFPVFGLPYEAVSELKVIGRFRTIGIDTGSRTEFVNVFTVTRIVDTGHNPGEQEMTIVSGAGKGTRTDTPIPHRKKKRPSDWDIPHDVPQPSDSDSEVLVKMGADIYNSYTGLDSVSIKDVVEVREGSKLPFFEDDGYNDGRPIDGLSTEIGGDLGGTTGHSRGVEDDREPVIQKSLLLIDDALPDLLSCNPDVVLDASDVRHFDREQIPTEFELLTACIDTASKSLGSGWSGGYLGKDPRKPGVPLISLDRFSSNDVVKKTGKARRALVAVLESSEYRILFADLERAKTESIGIFSLLAPINMAVAWAEISFILQYRLQPNAATGTWPNPKTHGGGYVAKVQSHRKFLRDEQHISRKLKQFISKLLESAEGIRVSSS